MGETGQHLAEGAAGPRVQGGAARAASMQAGEIRIHQGKPQQFPVVIRPLSEPLAQGTSPGGSLNALKGAHEPPEWNADFTHRSICLQ